MMSELPSGFTRTDPVKIELSYENSAPKIDKIFISLFATEGQDAMPGGGLCLLRDYGVLPSRFKV